MKRVTGRRAGLVGAVLAPCCLAVAAPDEVCPDRSAAQPARLVDSEAQRELVAELIPRWKSDENVRMIKFGAYVTEDGDLRAACCASATYSMTGGGYRKLGRKLGRLKFVPASHNGEQMRVYVGFTIVARKTSAGVESMLLMNRMNSIDDFGLHYSAPQRVQLHAVWRAGAGIRSPVYIEVRVDVSRSGDPSNAAMLEESAGSTPRDQYFAGRMADACFIPGFVDGVATAMPYGEAFAPR